MTACARGCLMFRRHLESCPAEDHQPGAFIPVTLQGMIPGDLRDMFFDGDTHLLAACWRKGVYVTRYGALESWHACNGCEPREATFGFLCERCHIRFGEMFAGRTYEKRWWPDQGSIAWAYDWLAADREPGQTTAASAKIRQGKRVPPAALALHTYVLREDLCKALGQWLRHVTQQFNLTGPEWWAYRVEHRAEDESSWRAWLPQDQAEVTDAQRWLGGWLGEIEKVPDLACKLYAEAEELLTRVAAVAPWKAKPRKLKGIACPECERDALVIFEGDDHVTCLRCDALVNRERYDIWSAMLEHERAS